MIDRAALVFTQRWKLALVALALVAIGFTQVVPDKLAAPFHIEGIYIRLWGLA